MPFLIILLTQCLHKIKKPTIRGAAAHRRFRPLRLTSAILQHKSRQLVSSCFSPLPHSLCVYIPHTVIPHFLPVYLWHSMGLWHHRPWTLYGFSSSIIFTATILQGGWSANSHILHSIWASLCFCMARGNTEIHCASCCYFERQFSFPPLRPLTVPLFMHPLLPPVVHPFPFYFFPFLLVKSPYPATCKGWTGYGKFLDSKNTLSFRAASTAKEWKRQQSIIHTIREQQGCQRLFNCMVLTFSECFQCTSVDISQ